MLPDYHELTWSNKVRSDSGRTCSNAAAVYDNILCFSDMDSIGVRAIPWCCYYQIQSFYMNTFLKCQMHFLCISEPQICYHQIVALIESHSLIFNKKKINKSDSVLGNDQELEMNLIQHMNLHLVRSCKAVTKWKVPQKKTVNRWSIF